jgi:hypothetical protein
MTLWNLLGSNFQPAKLCNSLEGDDIFRGSCKTMGLLGCQPLNATATVCFAVLQCFLRWRKEPPQVCGEPQVGGENGTWRWLPQHRPNSPACLRVAVGAWALRLRLTRPPPKLAKVARTPRREGRVFAKCIAEEAAEASWGQGNVWRRPPGGATVGIHRQRLSSTASTAEGGGVDSGRIVWERRVWGLGYRSSGDGGGFDVARLGCRASTETGMEVVGASCGRDRGFVPRGREGFEHTFVQTWMANCPLLKK